MSEDFIVENLLEETPVGTSEEVLAMLSGKKEKTKTKNIFEEKKNTAWKKQTPPARCDLAIHWGLVPRAGILFHSIYKKTLMGRLLEEIKEDDDMVEKFANEVSNAIAAVLGQNLDKGQYCIVTAPRRRHIDRNFATMVSMKMAERLHVKFYEDVMTCTSRHRVNAVFNITTMPVQQNIIVFDDIVTTGSTLASINKAFENSGKNLTFFAGINNKL